MADSSASLELVASNLLVAKYVATATGALAIYDYLLTLEDEIIYVWRGRKSWISALFIVNRYALLAYAILMEFLDSQYQFQLSRCPGAIYTVTVLVLFLFFSSDIFIFLRVFAVSGRNKFVGLYLPSLICGKVATTLFSASQLRTDAAPLPDIPLDEFKICTAVSPFTLQIVPHAIGVVFDLSAFLLILWFAYSGATNRRLSVLLKTIVADATSYFITVLCIQIIVLVSLVSGNTSINEFPINLNTVVTPTLVNRLVLSLKKTADVRNNSPGTWNAGRPIDGAVPETATPHRFTVAGTRVGTNHHHDIPLMPLARTRSHV